MVGSEYPTRFAMTSTDSVVVSNSSTARSTRRRLMNCTGERPVADATRRAKVRVLSPAAAASASTVTPRSNSDRAHRSARATFGS